MLSAGSIQHKQVACCLNQHPATACSGRIQNRFPATNSAQKHHLEAQAAATAERRKIRRKGITGNGYGIAFSRKGWNLLLLLNTKVNFSSNWPCHPELGICVDKDVGLKSGNTGR